MVAGKWAMVELVGKDGGRAGRLITIQGRAYRAPANAEASLGKAAKGGFQSSAIGQNVALRNAAIGKRQARRNGSTHRHFAVKVGQREPGSSLLHQEALDTGIRPRPHHGDVGDGALRTPRLLGIETPAPPTFAAAS